MILLSFIFLTLVVFIVLRYRHDEGLLWKALAATSTFMVVIIALAPMYIERKNAPKLEIKKPDYTDDFIRWGNEYSSDKRFYTVDIELRNIGLSIAKDCQPFLTAMGEKKNKKWIKVKNWAPIGLQWLLTKREQINEPYPEMRNLAPGCPYIFSLGSVMEINMGLFALQRHLIPTGQPEQFPPGEYCFEITVYSSNAKPIVKYFEVKWNGCITQEDIKNVDQLKKCLLVKMIRNHLWK